MHQDILQTASIRGKFMGVTEIALNRLQLQSTVVQEAFQRYGSPDDVRCRKDLREILKYLQGKLEEIRYELGA